MGYKMPSWQMFYFSRAAMPDDSFLDEIPVSTNVKIRFIMDIFNDEDGSDGITLVFRLGNSYQSTAPLYVASDPLVVTSVGDAFLEIPTIIEKHIQYPVKGKRGTPARSFIQALTRGVDVALQTAYPKSSSPKQVFDYFIDRVTGYITDIKDRMFLYSVNPKEKVLVQLGKTRTRICDLQPGENFIFCVARLSGDSVSILNDASLVYGDEPGNKLSAIITQGERALMAKAAGREARRKEEKEDFRDTVKDTAKGLLVAKSLNRGFNIFERFTKK